MKIPIAMLYKALGFSFSHELYVKIHPLVPATDHRTPLKLVVGS
jgi:hypothetical protein